MRIMIRNFDIAIIRTFAAVADHGSMTVAANMLHMTQGAISQQIKRLGGYAELRLVRAGQAWIAADRGRRAAARQCPPSADAE
ncbi:helix-turn-helix domain-containing protein [Rhizobium sp. SYY.PMSO]|uniref:helix-turn-helix domain-containing protein n=1 Tax=Rhizobium sp. SYY.PMSO TaxID=3382192 RepID=UPI0039900921